MAFPVSNQASEKKPQSVQRAVVCLWAAAGLIALATIISSSRFLGVSNSIGRTVIIVQIVVAGLLAFAFLSLVAIKFSAGKNWSRWFFSVFYILNYLALAFSLSRSSIAFLDLPVLTLGEMIVQLVLQTTALILMFTDESTHWVRAERAGK